MPLPFFEYVGARIVEATDGSSLLTLETGPQHFNSHGVVHGGALFTLADTGMGAALYPTLGVDESCATIEIKINYFRPVLKGEIQCSSSLVYRGRTTASLESTLFVAGILVGKATGTFAIFPRKVSGAV